MSIVPAPSNPIKPIRFGIILGVLVKFCVTFLRPDMTFIIHFRTSQEKRSTKEILSLHRVADDAVIRVYDDAGKVIETHEHAGDFKSCERRWARKTASQPSH